MYYYNAFPLIPHLFLFRSFQNLILLEANRWLHISSCLSFLLLLNLYPKQQNSYMLSKWLSKRMCSSSVFYTSLLLESNLSHTIALFTSLAAHYCACKSALKGANSCVCQCKCAKWKWLKNLNAENKPNDLPPPIFPTLVKIYTMHSVTCSFVRFFVRLFR